MRIGAGLALALVAVVLPFAPAAATPSVSRDHTLDLRDAYVAASAWSARGTEARSARPSDPTDGTGDFFWDPAAERARACGPTVCIHYVTTTSDAPPMTATDGVTPDWVRRNLDGAERSLERMAELGYPAPPSDGGRGDSAQFDVYLADIGRVGLYGYCAPETPVPGAPNHASSYCVFDNDFTGFPMPPDESLQVTVAHELFHAVQFGLDVNEDRWFLESTATWIEEQVADDINDNRQYLSSGQLGRRNVPLDHSTADLGIYGNWIFFQFLEQRYGVDAVRQVWQYAEAGPGARNDFSVRAVRRLVESHHDSFARVYAAFALANLAPHRVYDEGSAYRPAAVDTVARLGPGRATWRQRGVAVQHLTAHATTIRPRTTLRGQARLRIAVTATRGSGAAATARVFLTSGRVATLPIRLRRGDGGRVVSFTPSRVRKVVLVVANASTRYRCEQQTPNACQGTPRDDRQRFGLAATVVRTRR